MEEPKPILDKVVYSFFQDCNTNGSTGKSNETETLEITYESVLGDLDTEGGFFVLRTNGWSINDLGDLEELIERIKQIKFH
jgi:hypothetical protein